jgi:urea transport system permease protein
MPFKFFSRLLVIAAVMFGSTAIAAEDAEKQARSQVSEAIVADEDQQVALVEALAKTPDPVLGPVFEAWQKEQIFIYTAPDGARIPFLLVTEGEVTKPTRIDNEELLLGPDGAVVVFDAKLYKPAETFAKLRRAMRSTEDLLALADPAPAARQSAVLKLGMKQSPAALPILNARLEQEENKEVKQGILDAIALINLTSSDSQVQISALNQLKKSESVASKELVAKMAQNKDLPSDVQAAAASTLKAIDNHLFWVDFFGTMFRGVSLGSVLLIVALGLAITFGLMGVINMAHGEIMVVGGYATYLTQCIFGAGISLAPFGFSLTIPGFGFAESSFIYQSYFIVALPIAFLSAALVGLLLERGVIQFLYRWPLESLLATWGVSLVLQQLFRLIFGPANAPVYSPGWLLGSFSVGDVIMNYNRVFVIVFAALVVAGTALLLSKTPLGLLIRAVMQDRTTASCMGVRTKQVNMLTFAFGSGLAGLAGACLSQIGNIGPSTGQTYIVDSFMVVVVGGVGNLIGTVISALGIGTLDQTLQTLLRNPVIGKVLVLIGIILFLQWKPSGLFATKGRGLES